MAPPSPANSKAAKSFPSKFLCLSVPIPLKVRAIVRYRQGLRYGFEFLTLNDIQRQMIRRVCEMLASKA